MNNNQVTIVGHVGLAPGIKTFEDTGNRVAKFSIAVKEYSANKEERTLWLNVEAWNGLADRVIQTITKGREVVLHGSLSISSYSVSQDDGTTAQKTKPIIKLSDFYLCGKKPEQTEAETVQLEIKPGRGRLKAAAH